MQPALSVVTTVTSDVCHPSLLLQTRDGRRYVLGRVGAGFQRTLGEYKVKSARLQGIFLTGRLNWPSVSGLPGYLLSLGDTGFPNKLYSALPDKLASIVNAWRQFVTHFPLRASTSAEAYTDENVEIEPVLLGGDSTSYILQMLPVRGKFDVARAQALGVPKGPQWGELSKGNAVTLESGVVVQPSDVLGPSPTPTRVVILDLPTPAHVEDALRYNSWLSLAARKRKRGQQDADRFDVAIRGVYYFLDAAVDPTSHLFGELVRSFGPECLHHYVSHPSLHSDVPTLHSLAEFQAALRTEFPRHFTQFWSSSTPVNTTYEQRDGPVSVMKQAHVLGLGPPVTETSPEAHLETQYIYADGQGLETITKRNITEPEVITLGTGASAPSKYRNVSSTLVRVPCSNGVSAIMLDCGEGTLGSMGRMYGPAGRDARLQELDLLYVSHMHADHHLGTLEVVQQWQRVHSVQHRLRIHGPGGLWQFFNDIHAIDPAEIALDRIDFVDHAWTCVGHGYPGTPPMPEGFSQPPDSIQVQTCRAIHCPQSYNGSITFPGGTKVSYSGDTRPNSFFARTIGKDSDLLVHEATHEDALAAEAVAKRHSTISEAQGIARAMKARHTVLTHISQRYPRLPTLEGSLESGSGPVCFGFDGMRTYLSEISGLCDAVPRLSELFSEVVSDEEESSV